MKKVDPITGKPSNLDNAIPYKTFYARRMVDPATGKPSTEENAVNYSTFKNRRKVDPFTGEPSTREDAIYYMTYVKRKNKLLITKGTSRKNLKKVDPMTGEPSTEENAISKQAYRSRQMVDPATGNPSTEENAVSYNTFKSRKKVDPITGEPSMREGAINYRTFMARKMVDPQTGLASSADNAISYSTFIQRKARLPPPSIETHKTETEHEPLLIQKELQENEELLNKVKEDDCNIYDYLEHFLSEKINPLSITGRKRNFLTSEESLEKTPESLADTATFFAKNPIAKKQNLEIPSELLNCLKELRHLNILNKTILSDSPFLKNRNRNKILSPLGIKIQKNRKPNLYTVNVINKHIFAEWIDSESRRQPPTPENSFLSFVEQHLSPMDSGQSGALDSDNERATKTLMPEDEPIPFIKERLIQESNSSHSLSLLPAQNSEESINHCSNQQAFSPAFFGGRPTINPTSHQEIFNDDILEYLF